MLNGRWTKTLSFYLHIPYGTRGFLNDFHLQDMKKSILLLDEFETEIIRLKKKN